MTPRTEAALTVQGISFAYGAKKALDRVTFEVHRGQCVMLLGPNGAGKSTLFSLITRLYDSREGEIRIGGFDVRRQSRQALSLLGVVFQQATLDLDLTVMQNLRYHCALYGLSGREAKARIEDELARQRMWERRNERVRQLNGGHRRRVEIARALLHRPELLLLDEPTVGLDVPSRQAIVAYVHELCHEERVSVLWATHLIDEVQDRDRLIVLHRGVVRAEGGVTAVLAELGVPTVGEAFHRLMQDRS